MKGVIFTVFMEMVEEQFGLTVLEDIIEQSNTKTAGAYSRVGNYDPQEMLALVMVAHKISELPVSTLCKAYGEYLFGYFTKNMPEFFRDSSCAFEFLESVDGYIHKEVMKLYNDATPPSVVAEKTDDNKMCVTYSSRCPFSDVAEGLIQGCINHFGKNIAFTTVDQNSQDRYSRAFYLERDLR